ncbi:MAG: nuclear transport factor 2 family protein [Candidatus Thorarchaeota archaeon]
MHEKESLEFCENWLAAWTGNQPERLLQFYANHAFYRDPAKPDGIKGHDQLLPYFQKLLERNPDWEWKATQVFPTKDGFVLKWQARIPVGSTEILEEGMDIVEVMFGKITHNEVYFDRTRWIDALREDQWI